MLRQLITRLMLLTQELAMTSESYQERIGDWLLDRKAHYPEESVHELADEIPWGRFDPYLDTNYLRSEETAREYRAELEKSAAPQAKMMLRKLDGEEIGEEPILE